MSTPDSASRWAMPARKWRRPTGRDVAFALLWMLVVAGAVLLLTGETTGLVAVTIPIVFTFVSDHYVSGQADGEDDSEDDGEDDGEGSPEAPVRVRRALLIFGVGGLAWSGVAVLLTSWFNGMWPESATVRSWGLGLTLGGTSATLLVVAVLGMRGFARRRRSRAEGVRG